MGVFRVCKVDLRQASVMVGTKEIGPDSSHALVL
jgi:hypothetical protein